MKKIGKLILAFILGYLPTISAIAVRTGGWYEKLIKPSFNPPNWIFGPVWTILYAMIGVSFFLYLKKEEKKKAKLVYWVFGLQLILNALWPVLFFRFHMPLLAFIEILVLLKLIICLIGLYWKESRISAYLLIPYALWVSFASVLNLAIVILN